MAPTKLKAAILIISDTAFNDPSTDRSGDILCDVIKTEGGEQWSPSEREIVPDDILEIQHAVTRFCDREEYVNVLVTTGGTGFAVKDRTPEAVSPLIHRHAPGLM